MPGGAFAKYLEGMVAPAVQTQAGPVPKPTPRELVGAGMRDFGKAFRPSLLEVVGQGTQSPAPDALLAAQQILRALHG